MRLKSKHIEKYLSIILNFCLKNILMKIEINITIHNEYFANATKI